MGLFKPYSRDQQDTAGDTTSEAKAVVEPTESSGRTKSGPTLSRAEALRLRRERIHPKLTPKERRQLAAEESRAERMRSMAAVENAPGRRIVRDTVDSTWHITEFMLPVMVLMMVTMFALENFVPQQRFMIQSVSMYTLYGLLILWVIDIWMTWARVKKRLAAEAPGESRRGLLMYSLNRQMMMRRFRQPPATIKPSGWW